MPGLVLVTGESVEGEAVEAEELLTLRFDRRTERVVSGKRHVARECEEPRQYPPGRAVVAAMLIYDFAVAAVLAQASFGMGLTGVGLWPVVGLHTALGIWCLACLRPVNLNR